MARLRTRPRLLIVIAVVLLGWAGLGVVLAPGARSQGQEPAKDQARPGQAAGANRSSASEGCPVHANHLSWPEDNPVWTLCWSQPHHTTKDVAGSGLRLSHVLYKGKKVMEQASMPCVNVRYMPDTACDASAQCCGINLANNVHTYTYRDWMCQYAPFRANNVLVTPIVRIRHADSVHTLRPGYAEPTEPVVTLCDLHPNPGKDVGDFYGVAVEKRADRLVLTTALESGWYRYTQKWILHRDGRIQPRIAFVAVDNACTSRAHHHNAYWRLDFDLGDPENDVVEEVNDSPAPGAPAVQVLARETTRPSDPGHHRRWRIKDKTTGIGYEIVPGPDDGVADDWGVADLWALRYQGAREHDDGGLRPNQIDGARAHMNDFVNDEPIDGQDLVVWYRAGHMHVGGLHANCESEMIGPTLKPVGDW